MLIVEFFRYFAALFIAGYALFKVYNNFDLFQFIPFVKLKPLSLEEENFIAENFPIYREFTPQLKKKCKERIIWFRSRKRFIFYGTIERKEEIKLLLSATSVIMTLGLEHYRLMRSVIRIIIYPSQYYSSINRNYHLGEFNPNYKTLVFAADKIWEGFEELRDNRNLAMHEFAHALSFEMAKTNSWHARKFRVGLRRIRMLFKEPDFLVKLEASEYFREYGLTNLQEFFSVAVENYFETPSVFKNDFPELFEELRGMLKMDFHYNKEGRTFRTAP